MQVDVCLAGQLTPGHWLCWQQIQRANPLLAGPYFCPDFTRLVAAVCPHVYVAVIRQRNQIVGFFSFQYLSRRHWLYRHARPVAGHLSDYQGIILEPDSQILPLELIHACGLRSWDFDHLLASQRGFSPYWQQTSVSPIIDLTDGFEAYHQDRCYEHAKRFKQIARSTRQLAKEVGEIKYESHVADPSILNQLLRWKSDQCRRAGIADIFRAQWTRQLIEQIHQTQTSAFAGMLSVLYAGREIVAVHMGMRSETVWHYWFPSYDHRFKKYSPGLILLLEMAQDAASRGIGTIDLGKGDAAYKQYFSNGAIEIAEGRVFQPSPLTWIQGQAAGLVQTLTDNLGHTPVVVPARRLNALIRQYQR